MGKFKDKYDMTSDPTTPYVTRRMDEGPVLTTFGRLCEVLGKLGIKSAKELAEYPSVDYSMHGYIAQVSS